MGEDTSMPKIGLIARCDKTGLGQGQTLRLARLLKPDKVMLIDSTKFNGNEQYPWYSQYPSTLIDGFPSDEQIRIFLSGLDLVITCETFYNNRFTTIAKEAKVKTICVANPEFWDYFKPSFASLYPLPDKVIVPSYWMYSTMKHQFGAEYLPTPIFEDEFKKAREINLKRKDKRKYLFMNGKTAAEDRNGLESLYKALELSANPGWESNNDFTITIKAQHDVKRHPDPRLIYDFTNPENQADLYTDFDALILPRRYGGQALSMCEALLAGLPVVMTDIEPNNVVLPKDWLVEAYESTELMTRLLIKVYSAEPISLADRLDNLDVSKEAKLRAYEIGKQYDAESLRIKYEELLK